MPDLLSVRQATAIRIAFSTTRFLDSPGSWMLKTASVNLFAILDRLFLDLEPLAAALWTFHFCLLRDPCYAAFTTIEPLTDLLVGEVWHRLDSGDYLGLFEP
jgi:hypothetical protein